MPIMSEILRRTFRILWIAVIFFRAEYINRGKEEHRESRASRSPRDRVYNALLLLFLLRLYGREKLSPQDHHDSSRDNRRRRGNNCAGNSSDLSWKLKIDYYSRADVITIMSFPYASFLCKVYSFLPRPRRAKTKFTPSTATLPLCTVR